LNFGVSDVTPSKNTTSAWLDESQFDVQLNSKEKTRPFDNWFTDTLRGMLALEKPTN